MSSEVEDESKVSARVIVRMPSISPALVAVAPGAIPGITRDWAVGASTVASAAPKKAPENCTAR